MPLIRPIRIPTKYEFPWVQLWRWLTLVREFEIGKDWYFRLPNNVLIVIPMSFVFDGASIPKWFWMLLSPVGLFFIQGLIHDFAYRYDYLWAVKTNGEYYRYQKGAGRKHWDKLFYRVGFEVNGIPVLNAIGWLVLTPFGFMAWNSNRERNEPEIYPDGYKEAA